MRSKAEIRKEVEKAASEFTAKDLFSSLYFEEMLQATVTAVCEKLGRIPKVTCICDETNDLTAMTNGLEIILNTQGPLIKDMESNWQMYISNIGHVVHETGHILFTDFVHQNQMLKGWCEDKAFTFYPDIPDIDGARELAENLTNNPFMRMVYTRCMQGITNVLEDAYVENRLRENFDGLATAGLALVNEEMYKKADSLEFRLEAALNAQLLPIQVADSILLTRYVDGKPLKMGALSEKEQMLFSIIEKVLDNAKVETDALCIESNGLKRCELFNRLFVKLFPLMPKPQDSNSESENDSNESDDQSGEPSDKGNMPDLSNEAANEMLNSIMQDEKTSGKSSAPSGNTNAVANGGTGDAEDNKLNAEALASSKESMQRELSKAIREAAKEAVLEKDEQMHRADLKKEAAQIEGEIKEITRFSNFSGYCIRRGNPNKEGYKKIYAEVQRSSKNLTRRINNILKGREAESTESGFMMGQRFNAKNIVNHDGKYFSRQIVPDGKAEVAFGILIDESGSMACKDKYVKARRAAILLEDALRNIGVPLMVTGHTEQGFGDCTLHVYADFDTNDGKDPFRLASITADGGNIDGAAITYMGEKLLRRPEKVKVLIVISDGLPAGSSFYSNNANEDTKAAIDAYRRKKVEVFGAVVDSFDQVSALYGDKYCFDCREDSALETQLIRLIRRYVLMRG